MKFDKVYVTTIRPNEVRRQNIRRQLSDISFEFFEGLDMTQSLLEYEYVSQFPTNIIDKYNFDKSTASVWSKGQFGCYATFISILKDAYAKKYQQILFVEDDAIFSKDWQMLVDNAIIQLPADWDMLLLGTKYGNAKSRFKRPLIKLKQIITGRKYKLPSKYSPNLDVPSDCFIGLYATLISGRGIKKLLKLSDKSGIQGDSLIGKLVGLKQLNAFSIYPLVVKEGEFGSYTQKNNF